MNRGPFRVLVYLLATAALVGMSGLAQSEPRPRRTVQVGYASFYAPEFQGEETASGRTFDHRELVGAHRTLPFGSRVRVTNLENGRSVIVRIIDRGPFGKGRARGAIIDLSKRAARVLGFVRNGRARVRLELLPKAPSRR
jgi:rare lipoprotein A